jgi:hypothetical protein
MKTYAASFVNVTITKMYLIVCYCKFKRKILDFQTLYIYFMVKYRVILENWCTA